VRRLTSAEYAYAIADLTGVDIRTGIDASSDAVGGEGFANFGDVQFMQDATVERYLEAAKLVADHAVVGSGPLGFFTDPGQTGLELSALHRIEHLYATRGFRVVSGEGGRPFGFDRYAKAFYVAWHYRHRRALGEPEVTLRALAAREGITGRFAEHVWAVVNRKAAAYPSRLTIDRWRALPAPGRDAASSIANVRVECDGITKALMSWPSWFFARGDLAAGGQGDENPLVFDDTSLGVVTSQVYRHALNRRPGRPGSRLPAPWTRGAALGAAALARRCGAGSRGQAPCTRPDRRHASDPIGAGGRDRDTSAVRHQPGRHAAGRQRLRDVGRHHVRDRPAGGRARRRAARRGAPRARPRCRHSRDGVRQRELARPRTGAARVPR
jgi:hypothetical protein